MGAFATTTSGLVRLLGWTYSLFDSRLASIAFIPSFRLLSCSIIYCISLFTPYCTVSVTSAWSEICADWARESVSSLPEFLMPEFRALSCDIIFWISLDTAAYGASKGMLSGLCCSNCPNSCGVALLLFIDSSMLVAGALSMSSITRLSFLKAF